MLMDTSRIVAFVKGLGTSERKIVLGGVDTSAFKSLTAPRPTLGDELINYLKGLNPTQRRNVLGGVVATSYRKPESKAQRIRFIDETQMPAAIMGKAPSILPKIPGAIYSAIVTTIKKFPDSKRVSGMGIDSDGKRFVRYRNVGIFERISRAATIFKDTFKKHLVFRVDK